MQIIRDNVRLPESTIGDMHSGVAAARVGAARIRELAAKYGVESVLEAMEDLLDYGERMTIEEIRKLPAGSYQVRRTSWKATASVTDPSKSSAR